MLYRSTRDKTIKIESAQAIKTGLSKDGGLFVPETLPAVSSAEIEAMAAHVLRRPGSICIVRSF